MAPKSLTLQDMRLFQALNKVMAELFEYRVVLNGIASVKVQRSGGHGRQRLSFGDWL
jgi:hypothetical protein